MPKMIRRLDRLTSFRSRTPTNEQTASKNNNMVFDHSRQAAVVPDCVTGGSKGGYRTMNVGGAPMALHAFVGGSPDAGGDPLDGHPTKPGKIRAEP